MAEGIPLARPSAEVPRRESEKRGHKPAAGQPSEGHHCLLRTSSLRRAGRLCGPPWPDLPIGNVTHCHNSCSLLEQRVGFRGRADGDLQTPENPDSLRGLGSSPAAEGRLVEGLTVAPRS